MSWPEIATSISCILHFRFTTNYVTYLQQLRNDLLCWHVLSVLHSFSIHYIVYVKVIFLRLLRTMGTMQRMRCHWNLIIKLTFVQSLYSHFFFFLNIELKMFVCGIDKIRELIQLRAINKANSKSIILNALS